MTIFNIPPREPVAPRWTPNPEPAHPGLDRNIGDVPNPHALTASKKVDDLSRHESKHDTDPKHDPKHDPRDKTTGGTKPGPTQPQGEKHVPGSGKQ
jgi:hypothetical protein